MNPIYDFKGQVALVTGAAKGMGLATARREWRLRRASRHRRRSWRERGRTDCPRGRHRNWHRLRRRRRGAGGGNGDRAHRGPTN
jgi:NAD(P)-dependent dehydrogenase (short-subunit alcohol dehydrogenase family)